MAHGSSAAGTSRLQPQSQKQAQSMCMCAPGDRLAIESSSRHIGVHPDFSNWPKADVVLARAFTKEQEGGGGNPQKHIPVAN